MWFSQRALASLGFLMHGLIMIFCVFLNMDQLRYGFCRKAFLTNLIIGQYWEIFLNILIQKHNNCVNAHFRRIIGKKIKICVVWIDGNWRISIVANNLVVIRSKMCLIKFMALLLFSLYFWKCVIQNRFEFR